MIQCADQRERVGSRCFIQHQRKDRIRAGLSDIAVADHADRYRNAAGG